jgi:hypothetical protein
MMAYLKCQWLLPVFRKRSKFLSEPVEPQDLTQPSNFGKRETKSHSDLYREVIITVF